MKRYIHGILWTTAFPLMMMAQEGASLTVLVLDESDAAVPAADISLQDKSHGIAKKVSTDGAGKHQFDFLPPATYRLEVEKKGFDRYTIDQLDLHARDSQIVRIQLRVAAATKSEVTVTGEYEGMPTDASTGAVISGDYANRLPSNGRNLDTLVRMTPGVVSSGEPGGGVNVNGMRSNTNYYTVDGVSANTGGAQPGGGGPWWNAGDGGRVGRRLFGRHVRHRQHNEPHLARCHAGIPRADLHFRA